VPAKSVVRAKMISSSLLRASSAFEVDAAACNISRKRGYNDTSNRFHRRQRRTSRLTLILSQFLLAGLHLLPWTSPSIPFVIVSASSTASSKNYNIYQYDLTTPQFTPDGRLLQVEYASTAAELSPPLLVLECTSSDDDSTPDYPCLILLTIKKQAMSPQHRIVILGEDEKGINPAGFCVAMSGSLPDSLALLQVGLQRSAQHSLQYGSDSSMGMAALTRVLADECQSRVLGGGLRPYGSTLLLCGYDEGPFRRTERSSKSLGIIYQTDPSGGILQHSPPADEDATVSTSNPFGGTRHRDDPSTFTIKSHVRCIVGGSPSLQRQLHKRVEQGLAQFERRSKHSPTTIAESETTLAQRIAKAAKILIKETEGKFDATNSGSRSSGLEDPPPPGRCSLEVVVVSSRSGCHRLDEDQLSYLQQLIADMQ
jgi:hypothetical protein